MTNISTWKTNRSSKNVHVEKNQGKFSLIILS